MAKVVQLRGARPGGWAKDRWSWMGAVMAAPDLTANTKLVAITMAKGFANHETAECRPGLAALMAATQASRRTVLRALSDLRRAGWVHPKGGEAPGRAAAYVFRWPGEPDPERVPTVTPERVPDVTPERVPDVTPERVPEMTATGAKTDTPPIPPYKDKPQLNHNAPNPRAALRGLPMPHVLTHQIAPGSSRAVRWDEWLEAEGYPPLSKIGKLVDGHYRMPVTIAPSKQDEIPYRIARRWADWLRSIA